MRGGSNRGRERATEFQGKTVDDAIRAASHRFRVPPDELEIEVVEEGRVGFLGLGAKEARIRARLKPQQRRSGGPDERRGSRSGGSGGGRDRRAAQPANRRPDRGMVQGGTAPSLNPFGRERDEEALVQGRSDGGRRRRRGGRGRRDESRGERPQVESQDRRPEAAARESWRERSDRPARAETPAPRSRDSEREAKPQRAPREGAVATHDPALEKEISTFVEGLLQRMGFPATVTSRFEDGAYCLTVDAPDDTEGVLIGRKGETLDALQHVAYKMSGRGRDDASTVRIDIAGYMERRENELAKEAIELAKEVATTGRPRQTEPMRAAERRIVHRAISEIAGVTTRAIGTGLVKRISIEVEGTATVEFEEDASRSRSPRVEITRESAPREIAPSVSAHEVLDFVSQPGFERTGTEAAKAPASEWGRKPRPARPGRRR